jgi:amino acid adenylation domain-containing protein
LETAESLSDKKARLLRRALSGDAGISGPRKNAIPPRPPGALAPLTPEQRQIWLHASLAPDAPLYNEACTVTRNAPLDRNAVRSALNEIVRRHEILRSSFELVEGEVVQRVRPEVQVPLPFADLSQLPPAQAEAEARRLAAGDAREAFDLSKPPFIRARLVALGPVDSRLFLTLHHLAVDGVSAARVLVPELIALYEAASLRRPAILPPRPVQFGDYAVWRAARGANAEDRRALEYWKEALAGGPPELALPTDRPWPRTPSYAGSMERLRLDRRLVEQLKTLARAEGASLYMALLAGLSTLLHRYTGQQDFAVGGAVETRTRPELQDMMGHFVNTVALRCRPRPDQTFRDHLGRCRDVVLGALGASSASFEDVLRMQRPRRDGARHPIFSVMLSLAPPVDLPPGWGLRSTETGMPPAKFDLFLNCEEDAEGVVGRLYYSTELFDASTVRRMVGHLGELFKAAVAQPDAALGQLAMLTATEREHLLALGRGEVRAPPEIMTPARIREQAAKAPEAIAVRTDRGTWSYRELDRRADEIAAALRRHGVGRDTLVALFLRRSFDMVAALVAVGRAGGAYLPLDPKQPAERLRVILEDAVPVVLLADRAIQNRLPPTSMPCLLCDHIGPSASAIEPAPAPRPDDLAYVIYTSGSTGTPKGAEITHGGLANLLREALDRPGFGPSDRMLALSTLAFDFATLQLLLPLVAGGEVVIGPGGVAADPERLAAFIDEAQCTVIAGTPATWRVLVDSGWRGRPGLTLISGGDVLAADLARGMVGAGASVWNIYGPTETTIYSTLERVGAGPEPPQIGRPIANTNVYVLDPQGELAPQGAPGELHIGGIGLARGYRARADLNAERFVHCLGVTDERLYRTGDRARWRTDGQLQWLGRLDNQVKVRGFRIELEEVEIAMGAHPQVAMAAARVFPDASGELALVGYVAPHSEGFDPAQLRAHLRRSLPDYMVPSEIVVLPVLPINANRKVDRQALAPPEQLRTAGRFTPPATAAEIALAAIWEEVLGRSPVGAEDNFFDLGGHSLLVAKLLRQVEAKFGRKLSMAAIFDAPDVRRMAALLEEGRAVPRTVNIQPHGDRPRLFWIDAGPAFRPLSAALGPDQPFIGIELEEDDDPFLDFDFTLRDVGLRMVDAISSVQPQGPYYIGGFCASGMVAHQTARLLAEAGHQVPLLCMIHAPFYPRELQLAAWQIELSKAKRHLVEIARRGPRAGLAYAIDRMQTRRELARSFSASTTPFREKFYTACRLYDPQRYAGAVLLIQPREMPGAMDYERHWRSVIDGPFEGQIVPGDHITMFRSPNVLRLGEVLGGRLAAAQAAHAGA